jgi:hypothetical protein
MSEKPDDKAVELSKNIAANAVELPKAIADKTVKVKLLKPHRHNGKECAVDAVLTVNADAADFIIKNKIGVEIK